MFNPASPGELLKEFLRDITATRHAEHIGVARATISRVINGHTTVTKELSIRLGEESLWFCQRLWSHVFLASSVVALILQIKDGLFNLH